MGVCCMLFQTNADAFENKHLKKVRFSLNFNASGSCPSLWGCFSLPIAEVVCISYSSCFAFPTTAYLFKPTPLKNKQHDSRHEIMNKLYSAVTKI